MADKIRVLLNEEEVDRRIKEIAEQINKDYEGKAVHLICILKGGVFFTCELAKRLTVPVTLDFMSVSSYGSGTESSGVVKIIKDLAEKESCVIVGRCADYALSEYKDCFSVFVHADTDWRINRLSQKHNKTAKEAKDMINKTDKSRSSYYNYYTNKKWGAAAGYSLSVDSSVLGIEGAAQAIINTIHIFDDLKK